VKGLVRFVFSISFHISTWVFSIFFISFHYFLLYFLNLSYYFTFQLTFFSIFSSYMPLLRHFIFIFRVLLSYYFLRTSPFTGWCEKIWKLSSQLNREMIWKIWKKGQLNSAKSWKIWKKRKINSEKIWKIRKKSKLNSENISPSFFSIFYSYMPLLRHFIFIFRVLLSYYFLRTSPFTGCLPLLRHFIFIITLFRNVSWIVERFGK
jgi:hypothetical protein